jgi:hypothetical protein
VNPSAPSPAAEVSSAYLDALPAAKISITAEGWYVVTRAQLLAAGFDPGSDARMLQLFAEGVEQLIAILGQQGASLGSNGAIAFYGTAIDTPFSGTRVYWLVRGSQFGKRIPVSTSAGSGASSVQSFLSSVTLEQRTTYFAALLNGPTADNFFGAPVNTEPLDQDLAIQNYDPASSLPAQVTITLQGVTAGQRAQRQRYGKWLIRESYKLRRPGELLQHFFDRARRSSKWHQHRHPHRAQR